MSPADFSADPWREAYVDVWSSVSSPAEVTQAREAAELEVLRRSGLFDAAWYLAATADLGLGDADPLAHYHQHGWRMGRRPNPYFDPGFYLAQHPDIRQAEVDPLLHYLWFGEREGRRPVPYFDPAWYRGAYGLGEEESPLRHFLERRHGGTVSPIAEFDSAWYLRTYPDVAAAGMDPAEHYMVQGYKEARNPSPHFDTRFYRQRYLKDAPGENPLLHFLRHRDQPGIHSCMPEHEVSIPREVRRFTRPGPDFEEVQPLPASAPRAAKVLAYYLPQFHACPENDAWWGRGFTEWTNIARALPRFAGHYQPRTPRDLGHYTLDDGAVMRRQIELARGAGLHGFVFYFYWFNGRRLLDRPLETLLADPTLDFPFCLMWANENWSRRWDGSDDEVLISQDYRPEDEPRLLAAFARHFADSRYIRLQGRPVLMVYRASLIPDTAASVARWRRAFRAAHGEDPVFIMAQSFDQHDPRPLGMDAAVEFPPHKLTNRLELRNDGLRILDQEFSGRVYDYDEVVQTSLAGEQPDFPLVRTAVPSWDNDARRPAAGVVLHGSSPAKYQAWLERLIATAEPLLGERLVCVNAWNEWAEGA